jgi:AraC-like DNA-binding protein
MELFNFSGEDFEEAIETFTSSYHLPSVLLTPSTAEFSWRHRASGNSVMSFRSTRLMGVQESEVGAGDDYVVQWGRSGTLAFRADREFTPVAVDMPIMLPNGKSSRLVRSTDLDVSLVHINKDFVRDVAEELTDSRFDSFNSAPPISPHALRAWRSTVNMVATLVLDESAPQTSLLSREINRMVAIAMLDSFSYTSTERKLGAAGIEPAGVKEAYEFVYQNAHLPIGPIDIAAAVRMSVRSLQNALRRHRDTTPVALLRQVRLTRVHEELRSSDAMLTSVTVIARAWGFVQMGRFAGDYRAEYHESPSDTLRRSSSALVLGRR